VCADSFVDGRVSGWNGTDELGAPFNRSADFALQVGEGAAVVEKLLGSFFGLELDRNPVEVVTNLLAPAQNLAGCGIDQDGGGLVFLEDQGFGPASFAFCFAHK